MWSKLAASIGTKLLIKAIEWLAFVLPKAIIDWKEKKKRAKAQQEALEKYNNLPIDTPLDERGKAYEDLINSGR